MQWSFTGSLFCPGPCFPYPEGRSNCPGDVGFSKENLPQDPKFAAEGVSQARSTRGVAVSGWDSSHHYPCEVETTVVGGSRPVTPVAVGMAVGTLLRNRFVFLWRSWIPAFGQFQGAGPRPTRLEVETVGGKQWVRGGEPALTPSPPLGGCDARSHYCHALPGIRSPLSHHKSLSRDSHGG